MPGYYADYCTNSTEKKFNMYRFPRDENRRKTWIDNCNKADCSPAADSRLCEVLKLFLYFYNIFLQYYFNAFQIF